MSQPPELNFTDKITEISSVEDLRLILNQAELRNKGQNENADSMYQKAIIFLTISITALSSLIVYVTDTDASFTPKYVICWELIFILLYTCSKLKSVLLMEDYNGMGAFPNKLVDNDFYTDLNGKSPEWYLLQRLIIDYQKRVETNKQLNQKRGATLKDAIGMLFWTPGIILITYVLFLLFGL